jgi:hypothetical protein
MTLARSQEVKTVFPAPPLSLAFPAPWPIFSTLCEHQIVLEGRRIVGPFAARLPACLALKLDEPERKHARSALKLPGTPSLALTGQMRLIISASQGEGRFPSGVFEKARKECHRLEPLGDPACGPLF